MALADPPRRKGRWRAARFSAGLCSTVFVLAALAGCFWRPDALAPLTLVPPWFWLVGGTLSAAALWPLILRRWSAALLVFWLAFAVTRVEETRSITRSLFGTPGTSRVADSQPLRIVSLNCASIAGESTLADLRGGRPDIVLLQESPADERIAAITRELFGEAGGYVGGGDTAILARGSVEQRFVDKAGHFVAAIVTLESGPRVACISLRLRPPVFRMDVWSPGFWADHRAVRETHRRQLSEVARFIREIEGLPLIVGGDFNTTPLDPVLDLLRPRLEDTFASAGTGWGATGITECPLFRVDQIWTDERMSATSVRAVVTQSSDHRMVVCEVVPR